ncbi:MAG: hypothetical protein PHE77_00660, partial [Candidatus Pacebacteria bacterium]|nr:hypothetical protein [Candidatus Paceibacterota bacterium]
MAEEKNDQEIGGKGWLFLFIVFTIDWIGLTVLFAFVQRGWIFLIMLVGIFLSWLMFRNLVITFYFAPRHIGWTSIKEGTAGITLYNKEFSQVFVRYKEYYLDDGCVKKVVPGTVPPSKKWENLNRFWNFIFCRVIGGTVWYGWWPLYQRLSYHLVATVFRDSEPEKTKKYDKQTIDIFLPLDFYTSDYVPKKDQVIQDINKVPVVKISIVIPARIYNPYLAIYKTKNWLESFGAIIWPIIERFVAFFRYDDDLLTMTVGKGIADLHATANKVFHKTIAEGDDLKRIFWDDLKDSIRSDSTF